MARDPKQLRKAYEIKIGKDRADKLSDDQIGLLSKFYNQLSESEQSDIDSQILKGYNDTPLHQMAEEFISEKEDTPEDTSASVATAIDEDEEDDDDFEPLGLEELLGDIREEGKKENALAIYEGTREDDLVDEEIDERILRLLGLEEVFDIDYSTYLTLLKEKMVAARMTDSELSTEEIELLTNEFKRVKGKVGRFKLKKKNVSVDDIEEIPIKANKFLSPAKLDIQESEVVKEKSQKQPKQKINYFDQILENLISIKNILINQNKLQKEQRNSERKRLENERRAQRESEVEKKKKGKSFLKNLKKSLPSLGIFDMIKKFLLNVLLGKAVLGFLDWMSDKKNGKKLNALFKFLNDWWPALAAAFVLFATPLGGFIRTVVGMMTKFTAFILRKAIPKLLKYAFKNPLIAAALGGAALFGAGALIPKLFPETVDSEERKTESAPGSKEDKIKQLREQKENLNPLQIIQGVGQEIDEQIYKLETGETKGYSGGGLVTPNYFSSGGLVTPNYFSSGGLVTSNYFSKGGSVPSTRNVNYFSSGGLVTSNYFSKGGPVPSTRNVNYFSKGGPVPSTRNVNYFSSGGLVTSPRNVNYFSSGGLVTSNYFSKGGLVPSVNYFSSGGSVPSTRNVNYFSGGGFNKFPKKGTDTVPAMLTPGEFVVSAPAVKKIGVDNLMKINASGGGDNKPKVINGVSYAAGGGLTKPNSQAIKDYGSKLKYKSPIQGYPNYQKPTDEFGKFFARIYNAAKAAGDPFPEVVAAQAIEESNFGKSPLAKEANNLFGQDAPPSYPASKKYDYVDPIEGKHTAIKFSSIEESVKYRVKIWKKFYGNAKTPSEAIRNIAKAGYNPHAVYPGKIEKVLKEYGIVPSLPRPINDVKPQTPSKPNKKTTKPTGGSFLDMLPSPIRNLIPFGNRSQLSPNMEKRELQMILKNIQGGMLGDPNSPQNKKQIDSLIQRIHNLPRVEIPEQPSVASASMITLPPIAGNQNSNNMNLPIRGSKEPNFSTIPSLAASTRSNKLEMYGINA